MKSTTEKISCLIVTADRRELLKRSLYCYKKQTHPNTELVVVDNGEDTIDDLLTDYPSDEVRYVRVEPSPDNVLGEMRNISLENATGDYITCWDDDDWFHPDRIKIQLNTILDNNADACCLTTSLMHLNNEKFMHHPYKGTLKGGVPPSILHRKNDSIRYPSLNRHEDTQFLDQWKQKKYVQLPSEYAYLFIRCYHGTNTWEEDHFVRRMRNSPIGLIQYFWYAKIKDNLFEHPSFQLSPKQKEAFQQYLEDSSKFDLLKLHNPAEYQ